MMLHTGKLIAALEGKKEHFLSAERVSQADLAALNQALWVWENRSKAEIETELDGNAWPGALPTAEQDCQPLIVPFYQQWANHRQARLWALGILEEVTTFAADGSQISSTRDMSIPVGLVQIGWFENRHVNDGRGDYVKDISVEVLAPDELAGIEGDLADNEVEWRRFQGEMAQAERFMLAHADDPDHALSFFDGSLIVSFVQHMLPKRQEAYIRRVEQVLDISEQTKVPLIGYVDTSYADDLSSLISHLGGLGERGAISDAALLWPRMQKWGDRCRLYQCARDDRVLPVNGRKYYDRILITYLQTTAHNPPARIELPAWVLEAGRQEQILDIIRAECVVGTGYPYTLETADAVAVLTAQDRERFLAVFQQFAEREDLPLRFSRKSISKRQRRT